MEALHLRHDFTGGFVLVCLERGYLNRSAFDSHWMVRFGNSRASVGVQRGDLF